MLQYWQFQSGYIVISAVRINSPISLHKADGENFDFLILGQTQVTHMR